MEEASYYREQVIRARRLALESRQTDIRQALELLAQQYRDVAEDIERGAAVVRHPDLRRRHMD
jgi:hypothetical protein